MTVLVSNSTGLLHSTRTSSKGSIYMAHPACFCSSLSTSGITDLLQWGISPKLISCVYVPTLTISATAMTIGQRQWHGGGALPQAVELNILP